MKVLAWGLFAVAVTEAITGVTAAVAAGMTFEAATESFIVTNSAIGLSLGCAGVLLAWQRPRNPIGWLLLAAAVTQAGTAAGAGLLATGEAHGWSTAALRTLATFAAYAWPWSIALCLPLVLLLFPDGRPPGPGWRWLVPVTVLTAPLFVLEMGASPTSLSIGTDVVGYLTIPFHDDLAVLWTATEVRGAVLVLVALAGLGLRYRRGGERERRQLLWLLLAVLLLVAIMVVWGVFRTGPVLMLLAIPLVPIAITVAILRHGLLDIRLIVSRTVLYTLLTSGVIVVYAVLVTVLGRAGPGDSVLATVLIAVGFNPVRVRLQRIVDRLMYGDRDDPARALSRIGRRLADPAPGLAGAVAALCTVLRLPFAALRSTDFGGVPTAGVGGGAAAGIGGAGAAVERTSYGTAPERLHTVPLVYGGDRVGELIVGLRPGEKAISVADARVLELLAVPLAVAVHATGLSEELQRIREHIVVAREDERRRLRRDLHDGLGPTLTGVVYQADAAGNVLTDDPARAKELLLRLRAEVTSAIEDIRRLVYGLRPPALDDLGLVGALRQQAERLSLDVSIRASRNLASLPAAVEVAAYRIVTEALNNVARHARTATARIDLKLGDRLHVEVSDDGEGGGAWRPGVGLRSMRERAEELGGTCQAGPGDVGGGRVVALLPLAVAS
ncbi:sensor histidine kinase [Nonomuraea sp. 3N208]|uniref:sensor histidine kinase n=1 Tax=Nonomuraea sp. 3N208 TaxID=3457421 RepID=UPI003FD461AE